MQTIIWVRVPKNAGSSLYSMLDDSDLLVADLAQVLHDVVHGFRPKLMPSKKVLELKGSSVNGPIHQNILRSSLFNNAWKFAITRNPWDRAVSSWKFGTLFCNEVVPHRIKKVDFKTWCRDLGSRKNEYIYHHSRPQSDFLVVDGVCLINYFVRFEYLYKDLQVIWKKLGIKPLKMQKLNSTIHKPFYQYYDEESIKLVRDFYIEDFENFKYNKNFPADI